MAVHNIAPIADLTFFIAQRTASKQVIAGLDDNPSLAKLIEVF